MADSFGAAPVDLNVAISAYLVTLAVLIPVSGWVAERFGVRRVFLAAIVVFTLASLGCAASTSLPMLVVMRIFQGVGGAMMVPVGRLAVLRTTAKGELVKAIAYLTWPPPLEPKLVGIAGRNLEAVQEAATRYGFEYGTDDWHRLVEDPSIGLFDNSGPNASHAEPTVAAAQAGKHVVCEKPLGRDAAESYEIWQAVAATGVKHLCGFNYRFVPAIRLAREMLEELGFAVERAATAREAVDKVRGGTFHAVFSDIIMPGGMNGFELASELKREFADLPVLLTTSYSDAALPQEGRRDFPMIAKPYSLSDLARALRELLGRSSSRADG